MGAAWTHVLKHACYRAAQALPMGTQHGRLLQPLFAATPWKQPSKAQMLEISCPALCSLIGKYEMASSLLACKYGTANAPLLAVTEETTYMQVAVSPPENYAAGHAVVASYKANGTRGPLRVASRRLCVECICSTGREPNSYCRGSVLFFGRTARQATFAQDEAKP